MTKKIRSSLFFLKQYGFSSKLLEYLFLSNLDPVSELFHNNCFENNIPQKYFTKKDKELSLDFNKYRDFSINLYLNDDFLKKANQNKIYFKYDYNAITKLIPPKIMPLFMYAKGNTSLLDQNRSRISIIGTRKPSQQTIKITKELTKYFVDKGFILVSGLATGVDTISHKTTLDLHGDTIAILPTNFNHIYPARNKYLAKKIELQGLLLTSHGPNENTYKSNFLDRNKYVANISDIILVTESNLKSGTMNTIRNASEANKKILFVNQHNDAINNKIQEYGGEMIDG